MVCPRAFFDDEHNLIVDGKIFDVMEEDELPVERTTVVRHLAPCIAGVALGFPIPAQATLIKRFDNRPSIANERFFIDTFITCKEAVTGVEPLSDVYPCFGWRGGKG